MSNTQGIFKLILSHSYTAKVTFFLVLLTLVSSTFSFPLQELESLLDNSGTIVEGDSIMVRGLGITLANLVIGQKIYCAPSNLLQKARGGIA